jgi:UDPglucose 6-dehydrogenase
MLLFEPELKEDEFFNSKVYKDLNEFKAISDVMVSNCMSDLKF